METIVTELAHSLQDIEVNCWKCLLNGALQSRSPMHTPLVANYNGHHINMRTVVLRQADEKMKQLFFHTDIRSGKWEELNTDSAISWLFYDAAQKIQIRLGGIVSLHCNDVLADEAWAKTIANSRKIYMGKLGPSTKSEHPQSGLPKAYESHNPTLEASEAGRKNFGMVITQIQWMEWLWLSSNGHRRASFHYKEDKSFDACWLIP